MLPLLTTRGSFLTFRTGLCLSSLSQCVPPTCSLLHLLCSCLLPSPVSHIPLISSPVYTIYHLASSVARSLFTFVVSVNVFLCFVTPGASCILSLIAVTVFISFSAYLLYSGKVTGLYAEDTGSSPTSNSVTFINKEAFSGRTGSLDVFPRIQPQSVALTFTKIQ